MDRAVIGVVTFIVVGALVHQQLAIRDLQKAMLENRIASPPASVSVETPPAPEVVPDEAEEIKEPEVLQPSEKAEEARRDPALSLRPSEVEAVRAAIDGAKRRQEAFGASELLKAAALVQKDPARGMEALRGPVSALDKTEKLGSRGLIAESLKLLEAPNVDREEANRELANYYANGSGYMKAVAAGMLARRGEDSLLRDFLPEVAATELRSTDRVVRLQAVVNMAATKSPLTTPYLISMLRDEDLTVRVRAVEALGITGGDLALRELTRLQNETSPAIRDAAQRTLEKIQLSSFIR